MLPITNSAKYLASAAACHACRAFSSPCLGGPGSCEGAAVEGTITGRHRPVPRSALRTRLLPTGRCTRASCSVAGRSPWRARRGITRRKRGPGGMHEGTFPSGTTPSGVRLAKGWTVLPSCHSPRPRAPRRRQRRAYPRQPWPRPHPLAPARRRSLERRSRQSCLRGLMRPRSWSRTRRRTRSLPAKGRASTSRTHRQTNGRGALSRTRHRTSRRGSTRRTRRPTGRTRMRCGPDGEVIGPNGRRREVLLLQVLGSQVRGRQHAPWTFTCCKVFLLQVLGSQVRGRQHAPWTRPKTCNATLLWVLGRQVTWCVHRSRGPVSESAGAPPPPAKTMNTLSHRQSAESVG